MHFHIHFNSTLFFLVRLTGLLVCALVCVWGFFCDQFLSNGHTICLWLGSQFAYKNVMNAIQPPSHPLIFFRAATTVSEKWVNGIDMIIVFRCVRVCVHTGKIYIRKRYFTFRINVCMCAYVWTIDTLWPPITSSMLTIKPTKISIEPNVSHSVALFKLFRMRSFSVERWTFLHLVFLSLNGVFHFNTIATYCFFYCRSCHWICGLWSSNIRSNLILAWNIFACSIYSFRIYLFNYWICTRVFLILPSFAVAHQLQKLLVSADVAQWPLWMDWRFCMSIRVYM